MRLDRTRLLAARLRAAYTRPYLASALYAMSIVESARTPTMGVDRWWRCYVSPAFVARTPVAELAAVWLHEVAHLLRDHHGRSDRLPAEVSRHPLRVNVAADCEINDDLAGHGIEVPDTAIRPADVGLDHGGLFEEYARKLPAHASVGWYDCGSGAHGRRSPWELATPGDMSDVEAAALRRHTAIAIAEHHAGRDDGLGGWRRWADGYLEPIVDWRRLLRGAMRGAVGSAAGATDYTYRRPSRRAAALPGAVLPALRARLPRVALVVDTSASVSDGQLAAALAEVSGVLRTVGLRGEAVSVLACDGGAFDTQRVSSVGQVELYGGGGTDLCAGIDAALRTRPDVTVVLTDGGTPWPETPPPCRVVVGLFGDCDDWPPPWAEMVRIGG